MKETKQYIFELAVHRHGNPNELERITIMVYAVSVKQACYYIDRFNDDDLWNIKHISLLDARTPRNHHEIGELYYTALSNGCDYEVC